MALVYKTGFDGADVSKNIKEIGFRDCILEMSRYLINNEGFDINHPLRVRLITHLQTFIDDKSMFDANGNEIKQQNIEKNLAKPNEVLNTTVVPAICNIQSEIISSSSSPQKIDLNNCRGYFHSPQKQISLIEPHHQLHQSRITPLCPNQFSNNSALVQINITATNANHNQNNYQQIDNKINNAKIWQTNSSSNIYSTSTASNIGDNSTMNIYSQSSQGFSYSNHSNNNNNDSKQFNEFNNISPSQAENSQIFDDNKYMNTSILPTNYWIPSMQSSTNHKFAANQYNFAITS